MNYLQKVRKDTLSLIKKQLISMNELKKLPANKSLVCSEISSEIGCASKKAREYIDELVALDWIQERENQIGWF